MSSNLSPRYGHVVLVSGFDSCQLAYVRAREPFTADEDDHTKMNARLSIAMGLCMAAFDRLCSATKRGPWVRGVTPPPPPPPPPPPSSPTVTRLRTIPLATLTMKYEMHGLPSGSPSTCRNCQLLWVWGSALAALWAAGAPLQTEYRVNIYFTLFYIISASISTPCRWDQFTAFSFSL